MLSCPLPLVDAAHITLGHGGGGKLTQQLLDQLFLPIFANPALQARLDGAILPARSGRLALTTDSYVVRPLEFPGGDIGSLAASGTLNDLAMCGAQPQALAAAFVLEEGLATARLSRLAASLQSVAQAQGVAVVTGDTKVVERGRADGLYITTTGIGWVPDGRDWGPQSLRPGDAVLVSGDIGRHGIAILAARAELGLETDLASDVGCLWPTVAALAEHPNLVHALRDATRGGLAAACIELAQASGLGMVLDEAAVPVCAEVRGACELLGFEPAHIACEGRMISLVAAEYADAAVSILQSFEPTAARIGTVVDQHPGRVAWISCAGPRRWLELPSGEQLPRIC